MMTITEDLFNVAAMSRRQATADQLVWRSVLGLMVFVLLWTILATSLDLI
jgi:hypothetical protein